jgi:hypothetical protein
MAGAQPFKAHDDLLDQGDVLAKVPFVKWVDGKPVPGTAVRGVVTSNGCTCEDYERALKKGSSAAARIWIQVAPLRPAKDFRDKVDEIREGKRLDHFFIEGDGEKLQDQVVILTREQPFPGSLLAASDKVARLADWQWNAMLVHMAVSKFHAPPGDLFQNELLVGPQ